MALRSKQPPCMVDHKICSMQYAEDQVLQSRAMPNSCQKHRGHRWKEDHLSKALESGLRLARNLLPLIHATTVHATQYRSVQILRQVTREGHVPSLPEYDDAWRLVWRIEVDREFNRKHAGKPERHIGVA